METIPPWLRVHPAIPGVATGLLVLLLGALWAIQSIAEHRRTQARYTRYGALELGLTAAAVQALPGMHAPTWETVTQQNAEGDLSVRFIGTWTGVDPDWTTLTLSFEATTPSANPSEIPVESARAEARLIQILGWHPTLSEAEYARRKEQFLRRYGNACNQLDGDLWWPGGTLGWNLLEGRGTETWVSLRQGECEVQGIRKEGCWFEIYRVTPAMLYGAD